MDYHFFTPDEIVPSIFSQFNRHQVTTQCRKKIGGKWTVVDDYFIDDWDEEVHAGLSALLRESVQQGGMMLAAIDESGSLKGFAAAESRLFGSKREYIDLTRLYVSEELRGQGVGKALFLTSAQWAKDHGAKKLYISAHSSVPVQAFYLGMGCVEAQEYDPEHAENEPGACQMEYSL